MNATLLESGLYAGQDALSVVDEGFPISPRGTGNEVYESLVRETVDFLTDRSLDKWGAARAYNALRNRIVEAMTTDTFPLIFGDSLSREMRARYAVADPGMMQIVRRAVKPDFRTNKTFRVDGLTGRLQVVPEKGEYKADELTEDRNTYVLKKYGRQTDFSFEAWVNDDIGIFSEIAGRFSDAATNTLNWFITSLYSAAAGPIDAAFAIATSTNPLTVANLGLAIEAMNSQTLATSTGVVPLPVMPKFLVVGPGQEIEARQILTSTLVSHQQDTDSTVDAFPLPTANVVATKGLQLIVNPWEPIVNTTSGTTSWYLFADPGNIAHSEVGFLRGHENPEIHLKASNLQAVGGGAVSPFEGDFETDNIFYRIRHIHGGALSEDVAGYASTGAG